MATWCINPLEALLLLMPFSALIYFYFTYQKDVFDSKTSKMPGARCEKTSQVERFVTAHLAQEKYQNSDKWRRRHIKVLSQMGYILWENLE
jgi:hypothetical protein